MAVLHRIVAPILQLPTVGKIGEESPNTQSSPTFTVEAMIPKQYLQEFYFELLF